MRARVAFMIAAVGLSVLGCGRTEALWWTDIYASGSETEDPGDGDGDVDTLSTSTTSPGWDETTTDEWSDTSTTDPWDTDTTDTETTDTTDTTETETETETTTGCEDDVPVALSRIPPSVVFLLDQGAHMGLNFDGLTRWEAIEAALFGDMPAGVVTTYEATRALGLLSFTSFGGDQGPECPVAEIVEPQLGNGAMLTAAFAGLNPADDNPVADAIDLGVPLFDGRPGALILVTGRNPDTCAAPDPQQGAGQAVAAAAGAYTAGVRTYVVEVGNINGGYAQQLADAGAGQLGAAWWSPATTAALTQELADVVTGVPTCELRLDPPIDPAGGEFCTLAIGDQVILQGADGWSVYAEDHIYLGAPACAALGQGNPPSMVCTCDAF